MYTIICFYKFCEISSTVLCKKKKKIFIVFSGDNICLLTYTDSSTNWSNQPKNKQNQLDTIFYISTKNLPQISVY